VQLDLDSDLDSIDYQNFLAALGTDRAIAIPQADVAGLRSIDDLVREAHAHRSA